MKPRFLFDGMLGSLCRKMRMLGFDSALARGGESHLLLLRARDEGRIAVTTATRRIDRRGGRPVVLRGAGIAEMAAELLARSETTPPIEPFTLCLECNAPLERITAAEASEKVPPRIAGNFNEFHICPACSRIYWKGSHYEAMERQVEGIVERIGRR
jgi:uncharacterized protein with PIN domain